MKEEEQESGRRILLGDNLGGMTKSQGAADRMSVCWKWDISWTPLYTHSHLALVLPEGT
jgi:hypothetical protein